jgi:hypothetical protein
MRADVALPGLPTQGLGMGSMGGTYGGGPLACATACATLDVIQEEDLLGNAAARGTQLVAVRALMSFPYWKCTMHACTRAATSSSRCVAACMRAYIASSHRKSGDAYACMHAHTCVL